MKLNNTYGHLYEVLKLYKYEGTLKINGGFTITVIDNIDYAEGSSYGLIARITRGDDTAVLLFNDFLCIVESFDPHTELESLNRSNRDSKISYISSNYFVDPLDSQLYLDLLNVLSVLLETEHEVTDDEEEERVANRMSNSLYKEFSKKAKELKELFYDKEKYKKAKELLYSDIYNQYQNELSTFTEYYSRDNRSKSKK